MAIRSMNRLRSERGNSLVEAAMTIPILLLISVGIFEFGRAYQYWQVLTNAAREGARVSVTPSGSVGDAQSIALTYMDAGGVKGCTAACISVNQAVPLVTGTASTVEIDYPFQFILLGPIAKLVTGQTQGDGSITMKATATMRNEG
jgi:Flp pilus assembly protein TadG